MPKIIPEKITALEQRHSQLQEKVTITEQKYRQLLDEENKVVERIGLSKKELLGIEKEKTKASAEVLETKTDLGKEKESLLGVQIKTTLARKTLKEAEDTVSAKKDEVLGIAAEHTGFIESQKEAFEIEKQSLHDEIAKENKALEQLQKKIEKATAELDRLNLRVQEARKEIEKLGVEREDLHTQKEEIENIFSTVRNRNDKALGIHATNEEAVHNLGVERAKRAKECKELAEQKTALEKETELARLKNEETKKQTLDLLAKHDVLQSVLDEKSKLELQCKDDEEVATTYTTLDRGGRPTFQIQKKYAS